MGYLISVEGGEFTGKTSLVVPALETILRRAGYCVKTSREPGGTPTAEAIREKIFQKLREGATQNELALLFNQARKIHLQEVIIPFLGARKEKNAVLILDRYLDSTMVYQGLEGGVPLKTLVDYEQEYALSFYPDLTLILFFPEDNFSQTLKERMRPSAASRERSKTSWDEATVEEHYLRQKHYLSLPRVYKQMGITREFTFIDASRYPYAVIKDSLVPVASLLEMQNQGKENLLRLKFKELVREGCWREINQAWCEQKGLTGNLSKERGK